MKILGIGSYLPDKIITNKDLEKLVDTNDNWIQDRLGIKERRQALSNVSSSDLGYEACLAAIENSGIDKSKIDLLICVTSTPDRISPSTACIIQEKLQINNTPAFDLNAVCSGFVYGLTIANSLLKSNTFKKILLVATETYSKITNYSKRDCVFFGDGAAAVILEKSTDYFFDSLIMADGTGIENFTVKAGGSKFGSTKETIDQGLHYFEMNGKEVYKTGTKVLPECIKEILTKNNLNVNDISWMAPHQPSIKILEETAKSIGLDFSKVLTSMDVYANTAGASIPITLDKHYKKGSLKRGDLILLAAVGSGWTWGSCIIEWSK